MLPIHGWLILQTSKSDHICHSTLIENSWLEFDPNKAWILTYRLQYLLRFLLVTLSHCLRSLYWNSRENYQPSNWLSIRKVFLPNPLLLLHTASKLSKVEHIFQSLKIKSIFFFKYNPIKKNCHILKFKWPALTTITLLR